MSITIQLNLPDAIVEEARANGLLDSGRIESLLTAELERERELKEFTQMLTELRSIPSNPMTEEEVQVEIDAIRAERRKRAGAGSPK